MASSRGSAMESICKLWAMLNAKCGQEFYLREGRSFIRHESLLQIGDAVCEDLSGQSAV